MKFVYFTRIKEQIHFLLSSISIETSPEYNIPDIVDDMDPETVSQWGQIEPSCGNFNERILYSQIEVMVKLAEHELLPIICGLSNNRN